MLRAGDALRAALLGGDPLRVLFLVAAEAETHVSPGEGSLRRLLRALLLWVLCALSRASGASELGIGSLVRVGGGAAQFDAALGRAHSSRRYAPVSDAPGFGKCFGNSDHLQFLGVRDDVLYMKFRVSGVRTPCSIPQFHDSQSCYLLYTLAIFLLITFTRARQSFNYGRLRVSEFGFCSLHVTKGLWSFVLALVM